MATLRTASGSLSFQTTDDIVDLSFADFDSPYYLPRLDPLEGENLVQFSFELRDKRFLIIFVPRPPTRTGILRSRLRFVWGF